MTLGLTGTERVRAASVVDLGTAEDFAVLADTAISDATPTGVITGDVGLGPTSGGSSITGLTSPQVSGTIYAMDAAGPDGATGNDPTRIGTAKSDLTAAYNDANGQAPIVLVGDGDLGGGETLTPGVYSEDSTPDSLAITGELILDGGGDPNAVFIFQSDSTLITASNSAVTLTNGTQACNVFWQVGSSATLGTNSTLVGTLLAFTSITDAGGSVVSGRLLARNGAVSLNNTDITVPTCAPALLLQKTVTTDNGGTALSTAWTLTATGTGGSPTNLTGATPVDSDVSFSDATFQADTYTLAESGGPTGYTASTYSCVKNGGGAVVSNTITLVAGDNATCTITNNDQAPSLTLDKVVVNDNTGIALASDWTLTATGATTISGPGATGSTDVVSGATFSAGTYTLSESAGPTGYTASAWGCVKNAGAPVTGASIAIGLGDTATCTITNDDTAPVVDPPAPATLNVIKTVTNDNGGTAVASAFTVSVTGTNVSSTSFAGAESPGTSVTLDAGAYSIDEGAHTGYDKTLSADCSGTVGAGETKTCTITNDDTAVVVSDAAPSAVASAVEESDEEKEVDIKVTKKATPSALPLGPGSVTYTYTVTNEGDVSLKDVSVKDDKCSPVEFVSGDGNHNDKLGLDEKWKYTCTQKVSQTVTNKVTARGSGNGVKVRDTDKATVVVSIPQLPYTGFAPQEERSISLDVIKKYLIAFLGII